MSMSRWVRRTRKSMFRYKCLIANPRSPHINLPDCAIQEVFLVTKKNTVQRTIETALFVTDVDECSSEVDVCKQNEKAGVRCVNMIGGYSCKCQHGFVFTPFDTSCTGLYLLNCHMFTCQENSPTCTVNSAIDAFYCFYFRLEFLMFSMKPFSSPN